MCHLSVLNALFWPPGNPWFWNDPCAILAFYPIILQDTTTKQSAAVIHDDINFHHTPRIACTLVERTLKIYCNSLQHFLTCRFGVDGCLCLKVRIQVWHLVHSNRSSRAWLLRQKFGVEMLEAFLQHGKGTGGRMDTFIGFPCWFFWHMSLSRIVSWLEFRKRSNGRSRGKPCENGEALGRWTLCDNGCFRRGCSSRVNMCQFKIPSNRSNPSKLRKKRSWDFEVLEIHARTQLFLGWKDLRPRPNFKKFTQDTFCSAGWWVTQHQPFFFGDFFLCTLCTWRWMYRISGWI